MSKKKRRKDNKKKQELKGQNNKNVVFSNENVNKNIEKNEAVDSKNSLFSFMKKKSISNWLVILIVIASFLLGYFTKQNLSFNNDKTNFLQGDGANNKKIEMNNKEKIDITKYPKQTYDGKETLTKVYPIFDDVEFIGDSYAFYLAEDVGNIVSTFAYPGLKISRLSDAFVSASKEDKKYSIIFIGPNDLADQTDILTFTKILKHYVNILQESGKIVFITSYLQSEFTDAAKEKFASGMTVQDYDNAIQEVCKEKKATYLDAKDMNDYKNCKRISWDGSLDGLHFNQEFNIKLVNRIYDYIYDMEVSKK